MTKQQEKILKVLDMSGEEQRDFVRNILIDTYYSNWMLDQWDKGRFSLADLAFRLRDEVCKENYREFHNGIFNIQTYLGEDNWATAFWGECFAKPIHWIIAALLAKESK